MHKFLVIMMSFALALTAAAQQGTQTKVQNGQPAKTAQEAPQKQTPLIALRGGRVMTIAKGTIENGVVVMQNGRIVAVGPAGQVNIPRGARVIDVKGMTVYPGLIDSETQLGLTEISAVDMTNDLVESSDNITPHMHVDDAFHAESSLIPVTRINGVTNAVVTPADRNSLPGQSSLVQLAGATSEEMLLVRDLALPVNFTGRQRRNESFERAKFPMTRMGVMTQLRQAFIDALDYQRRLDDCAKKPEPKPEGETKEGDNKEARGRGGCPPKRELKHEALLPYLKGAKPVVLAAEEPSDIKTALRLAQDFKLKVILNRVTYSQRMIDELAAAKLPVIVSTVYERPKEEDRYDTVFRLPVELHQRGVKIAFATSDAHNVRNLPYMAGYAVAFGMPHDAAMRALTLNPAEIWGVADQLGSLEPGKMANVVVANGDPLDVRTDVKHVFIAGEEVPLESRQTRLRDMYWPKPVQTPAR